MTYKWAIRIYFLAVFFLCQSIVLSGKHTCTVTVVDIQSAPVQDAEVIAYEKDYDKLISEECSRILCDVQKTNQHGQVMLDIECGDERNVMVVARKEGYAMGWDVLSSRDQAVSRYIILDGPKLLAGRLLDHQGRPVVNASIQAQPKSVKPERLEQNPVIAPVEWMTTQTDKQGYFRWDCFGEDVNADFLITVQGAKTAYKYTTYYLASCGYEVGRDDICLKLPKQTTVHVCVVDDKGRGIPGMTTVIRPNRSKKDPGVNYVALRSVTDKNGRCSFEDIPFGNHSLSVLNTDTSMPWTDKVVMINTEDTAKEQNITIQLEKGGFVEVTMLDESTQKPIEGMYVRFSQAPNDPNQGWFSRAFDTDTDGKARVIAPQGKCNIRCWDSRYERRELELPVIEGGKSHAVTFSMAPQKPITGEVKNPDGTSAANVFVRMTWGQNVLTDSNGAFQCTYDSLREGMCLIARDIENNQAVVSLVGNPGEPALLTLKPARVLKGTVVDPNGDPIPAARVRIDFSGPGYLSDCCPEVLTNKSGQFEFKAIPSDLLDGYSFRISTETMNHGARTYERLQIQEETDRSIELKPIEMSPAELTLDGFVVNEDGTPATELPIFLQGKGQYGLNTVTDQDGRFAFHRLCKGEVRLQAGIGGEDFEPGRMVAQGGDTNVKIVMGQDRIHVPKVSLAGKRLPEFNDMNIAISPEQLHEKPVLVCFWDFKQRPSRYTVGQLAGMKQTLVNKNIEVVLIHTAQMDDDAKKWLAEKELLCHMGYILQESESVRKKCGVQALPWLILTDAEHNVVAEGFSVEELEGKLGSQ